MNNNWDRTYIGIMSLGYLIAASILVAISLGWTTPLFFIEEYLLKDTNRWIVGLSGTVIFVVALTLFWSSFRTKPVKQAFIHETSLGLIKITIPALENLVLKSAKSVQGIRDVKPLLKVAQDGVVVHLRVQILPDVNIPNVTEVLQKTIKEYVQKTAGINIQEIKILINRVSWETKSRVE